MNLLKQSILLFAMVHQVASFISPSVLAQRQSVVAVPKTTANFPGTFQSDRLSPTVARQRHSVASVQMQGLFGLGLGEIAVILVVVGFVLGPQTLGRLVKTSANRASAIKDELQRVPEEFQKGVEEGESNARSRKARVIKVVKDEDEDWDRTRERRLRRVRKQSSSSQIKFSITNLSTILNCAITFKMSTLSSNYSMLPQTNSRRKSIRCSLFATSKSKKKNQRFE